MRGRFELVTRVPRASQAIWAPTQAGEWIVSKNPGKRSAAEPHGGVSQSRDALGEGRKALSVNILNLPRRSQWLTVP